MREIVIPVVVIAACPVVEFRICCVVDIDGRWIVVRIAIQKLIDAPPSGNLGHMHELNPVLTGCPCDVGVVRVGWCARLPEIPACHAGRLLPVVAINADLFLISIVGKRREVLGACPCVPDLVPDPVVARMLLDEHHEDIVARIVIHDVDLVRVVAFGAVGECVRIPFVHIVVQQDARRQIVAVAIVFTIFLVQNLDERVRHEVLRFPDPFRNPDDIRQVRIANAFDKRIIDLLDIPHRKFVDFPIDIGEDICGVRAAYYIHQIGIAQSAEDVMSVLHPTVRLSQRTAHVYVDGFPVIKMGVERAMVAVTVVTGVALLHRQRAVVCKRLVPVMNKGDLCRSRQKDKNHQNIDLHPVNLLRVMG